MPWEAIFKGRLLFLLMILVGWGQDCPRRCLLAIWTPFVHPWTFLPPRHGPWALYEVGQGCWVLRPHRSIGKKHINYDLSYGQSLAIKLVAQYFFLLEINFDKSTIGLHFLSMSFMLAKFLENSKSIAMSSSINCLNCKFLQLKIMHKI